MGCGRMIGPYECCSVVCCDCLEAMKQLPDGCVDAVITDPPYLDGDLSAALDDFLRIAARTVLTPGKLESFNWIARRKPDWEYAWRGSSRSLGGSACLHIGFEPILAYGLPFVPLGNDVLDYPVIVYRDAAGNPAKNHPWPKPEGLFSKLVAHWTRQGETVLDPYTGTGTTLTSAKRLGRHYLGFEISPEYCKIAEDRLARIDAQPSLFQPKPEQLTLGGGE